MHAQCVSHPCLNPFSPLSHPSLTALTLLQGEPILQNMDSALCLLEMEHSSSGNSVSPLLLLLSTDITEQRSVPFGGAAGALIFR